jgi:hypothetical protein
MLRKPSSPYLLEDHFENQTRTLIGVLQAKTPLYEKPNAVSVNAGEFGIGQMFTASDPFQQCEQGGIVVR